MSDQHLKDRPRFWRTLGLYVLLAGASVLMLWQALPGFEQWYLSFVALVPILVVLQGEHGKSATLITWLAGFAFFYLALSWLSHLTPVGWRCLTFYLSLGFLLSAILLRRLILKGHPRMPFVLGVPVFWLAVQLMLSLPLDGFSWYLLGNNLYRQLTFIQIADVVGVYGISFVVLTVNATLARLIHLVFVEGFSERGCRREAVVSLVYTGVLVLVTVTYGTIRLAQTSLEPGPTVSVVQGNIPQELKEQAQGDSEEGLDQAKFMWETYRLLTLERLGDVKDDLVVWPETITMPLEGDRTAKKDYSALERRRVVALRRRLGRPFMVGALKIVEGEREIERYNCAFYFPFDNDHYEIYAKIHPVPFGERVPFKEIDWVRKTVEWFMPEGYEARLSAGTEKKLFKLKDWQFAANICYEDTKPSLNREYRRMGADFIVNLTNDGWFRDTAELDQHLANSVFRSVESRVSLVRATNTGISAFINPTGKITSYIRDAEGRHRRIAGVLTDTVMLDERRTLYMIVGDLFAWLVLCVAAGLIVLRVALRVTHGPARE